MLVDFLTTGIRLSFQPIFHTSAYVYASDTVEFRASGCRLVVFHKHGVVRTCVVDFDEKGYVVEVNSDEDVNNILLCMADGVGALEDWLVYA